MTIVTYSDYTERRMEKINVSEFKAICLRLLERVKTTGEPIEILKNGKPLAVVYPADSKRSKSSYGALKDTLSGKVGDLVSPLTDNDWEALIK